MGLTRKIAIAVVVAAAISAAAAETAAAESQPLVMLGTEPLGGRPPAVLPVGAKVEGLGNVQLAWKLKSQGFRCETEPPGEGLNFGFTSSGLEEGARVASNSQPIDQITIPRLKTEESECIPAPGVEANVYQETEPLVLSASSSGKAELSSPSGKIAMLLQIFEGTVEKLCHYEKAQLKGTNTATPPAPDPQHDQALAFAFSAEGGANALNLNEKAANSVGCPTSFEFGMDTTRIEVVNTSGFFNDIITEHVGT
jgi:hypothetical protein